MFPQGSWALLARLIVLMVHPTLTDSNMTIACVKLRTSKDLGTAVLTCWNYCVGARASAITPWIVTQRVYGAVLILGRGNLLDDSTVQPYVESCHLV